MACQPGGQFIGAYIFDVRELRQWASGIPVNRVVDDFCLT
jgi:hypothetical protein